jgi:hypothetical protein
LDQYEKNDNKKDDIVVKLTSLKNIFKEIKYIRTIEKDKNLVSELSKI